MLNFSSRQPQKKNAGADPHGKPPLSLADVSAAMDAIASGDTDRQQKLDAELRNAVQRMVSRYTSAVSYTHLTLPTNREV